ncbi:MAG: alpha/beta fold hydrolase [Sphingobacteriaceae bacterium]|nr:MAG: alpha/beta fold hydrolase [Sphingobacteriaceae bacterium]
MRRLLKVFAWLAAIIVVLYGAICIYFYSAQDGMLFPATKFGSAHQYKFDVPFKEYKINAGEDTLSGVLFKADKPTGLIFYLHGNGGTVEDWSIISPLYTMLGYDLFIIDYPGYGKSTGHITNEAKLITELQAAYETVKAGYTDKPTVFMGYSIGTGLAAQLASKNECKQLVLMAPYYSMPDLAKSLYPFLPSAILKYRLETYKYLPKVKAPVTIFHGLDDGLIYYGSSIKLKKHFKATDRLFLLKNQGHNEIQRNPDFQKEIKKVLL